MRRQRVLTGGIYVALGLSAAIAGTQAKQPTERSGAAGQLAAQRSQRPVIAK